MVEVMKTMVTSFKQSHAITAAGHHWPMPPPETPGHAQEILGQSLVGSLLLAPIEPMSLALVDRFFTTEQPGKQMKLLDIDKFLSSCELFFSSTYFEV